MHNDYGFNEAEEEKISKYQELKNYFITTWPLKEIYIIPVVVGVMGITNKNLKNISKLFL